jgi:hypothetical protein
MPNDFNTNAGKVAIVRAVFRRLRNNEVPISDFLDCTKTKAIVETLGDTTVPANVKVYALPEGDRDLLAGRSLILEIPPAPVPIDSEELLTYACTYTLWREEALVAELAARGVEAKAMLFSGEQIPAQADK